MRFAVVTFGCRVNQADSLALEAALCEAGGQPVPAESADVVVVNTCSVTALADQGGRQSIRRLARVNPNARIVATGCYATREPGTLAALPGVVRVVSNHRKDELARVASEALGLTTAERFGAGDGACGAALEPGLAGRTAWTLRVQTGCDEHCAYCIIPRTRGSSRSRLVTDILRELDRLAAAHFREVAITGVHLGSYGRDLTPATSLEALLSAIAERGYPMLFRVSSLEPMDCGPGVVDLVSDAGCFAWHFHLPLQHASDRILRAMRRPYTLDVYRRLVDDIRGRLPDAAIGADVIAGFPGEGDDDCSAMIEFLEASPLTHLHVFPYSDRPGTPAESLPRKVPGPAIRERAERLRRVGRGLADAFRRSQVGKVRRGLTLEDGTTALTDNYLKVRLPPGRARNELVRLRVVDADGVLHGIVEP
jgi:threonylcarbamoyladenosine tRNA methylthiotransferase MtaB